MHKYLLDKVDVGEFDNTYYFTCRDGKLDECDSSFEAFAVDDDFLYLHSPKHPGWVKANDVLDEEDFKTIVRVIKLFVMDCSSCGNRNNKKFITITDRILCPHCLRASIEGNRFDTWL